MRTKYIIALIIILLLGWYISQQYGADYQAPPTPDQPTDKTTVTTADVQMQKPETNPVVSGATSQINTGRLVFGVTDKAANLDKIRSINITISGVRVHSPKSGWTDVSKTSTEFDLLKLRSESKAEFLADINIPDDSYDMIRLVIGNIIISNLDGTIASAKIPSNELKINSNVRVIKGKISSVLLDFLADKSLHQTGDGKYIFLPVIIVETKSETTLQSSTVQGQINKKVEFIGGNTNFSANLGMGINGELGINNSIDPSIDLEIMNDTVKVVPKKTQINN